MKIQPFTLGEVQTNCYVVYDMAGDKATLIDAPDGIEKVISFINANGLEIESVLLTHAHFDHVMGLGKLKEAFPALNIYLDKNDEFFLKNKGEGNIELLTHGFPFMLHAFKPYLDQIPPLYSFYEDKIYSFNVIRTPGHTKGSVCLYDEKENIIFTGDTIFRHSYGRTDFPGGSEKELFRSIKSLISSVQEEALVLPGHGGRSTIKEEKAFYGLL